MCRKTNLALWLWVIGGLLIAELPSSAPGFRALDEVVLPLVHTHAGSDWVRRNNPPDYSVHRFSPFRLVASFASAHCVSSPDVRFESGAKLY